MSLNDRSSTHAAARAGRAFLTDLDGTLLRSDGTLSTFATEVLTRAIGAGHVVSFATARSLVSAAPKVGAVPWQAPVIVHNGALIMDPATGAVLASALLDNGLAARLLELGRTFDLEPFVLLISPDGKEAAWYDQLVNAGAEGFLASRRDDPRFCRVAPLQIPNDQQVIGVSFVAPAELLEPLAARARSELPGRLHLHLAADRYLAGYSFLEFTHPLAHKGQATRTWTRLVGAAGAEITVFGDNLNDRELFAEADVRVAVANAHPELRAAADIVVADNDADGVAHYLAEQLWPDEPVRAGSTC